MTSERSLTEYEQDIIDNIEEYGCQVTSVFDPDGNDPGFAYSIGFAKTVAQPEVIIFGLATKLMHSMINGILEQCRSGLKLSDGVVVDDLLEGFQCVVKEVHASQIEEGYFNSSMWFHSREFGAELTEALQIFWPGAQDRKFPWDAGSSDYVRTMQPALYEPRMKT